MAVAASFDRAVAAQFGDVIGVESRNRALHVLEGPGLNLARVPQGGRHFEYFGEDPFLTGTMAVAEIRAMQKHGVIAMAKHFIANDHETNRTSANVIVSDRALHELYLLPFEMAVRSGDVASIMCSYNSVNGPHACEDAHHLTDVLRKAAAHRGTAFVEIYQNCNVFNDGAFDLLREKQQGVHHQIRLEDGEPIIFDEGNKCVIVGDNGRLQVRPTAEVDPDRIVVHQAGGRPSLPFGLAHLSLGPHEATCFGVFRDFDRTVYGEAMYEQLDRATERLGTGSLDTLLHGGDTWTVA